jgi:hypothetical protein
LEELLRDASNPMNNFHNMFDAKHIMEKISKNPKLARYMAQPDFTAKLAEIQRDPQSFAK